MSDRSEEYRRHAITALGLTKGFTPEQRAHFSNALKTVEEFAGYILELTASQPLVVKGVQWVKAIVRLPLVPDRERIFVKYNNGNTICNLVCLYDSGRFHSAEWGILPNERVEYLDETGDFKSSYVQEYKQMKEYEKFLGGETEWTEEKVKGMNRMHVLEALKGYQELIRFLDNTIYAIEEGSAQWEERAKQAESPTAAGDGKEDAVAFMNWSLSSECDTYNCTDEDEWTNIYTKETITTAQLYDIFKNRNKFQ